MFGGATPGGVAIMTRAWWDLRKVAVVMVLALTACVKSDLTAEFINEPPAAHLLLTCSTEDLPRGAHVVSIIIHNGSLARGGGGDPLVLLTQREAVPMFGNASRDLQRRSSFISGLLHKTDAHASRLQLLLLFQQMSEALTFSCRVTFLAEGQNGIVDHRQYERRVEVPVPKETPSVKAPEPVTTPLPKPSTKGPEPEPDREETIRTGNSVQHATVVQGGIPMEVLIIMLVLIALLFIIVCLLLLQKFRRRCSAQPVAYPGPHYMLAGDMAWEERLKGSRPSLHTVGLRSHYSLPRPLQPPPPPPPKLHRTISKDSADYAERSCLTPAGMIRTFHYTTPYDAIIQDCDGELSLLNTSAHCDITPPLPPEQCGGGGGAAGGAAELAYRMPPQSRNRTSSCRTEAPEAQPLGQGHSLFAMGPDFAMGHQDFAMGHQDFASSGLEQK